MPNNDSLSIDEFLALEQETPMVSDLEPVVSIPEDDGSSTSNFKYDGEEYTPEEVQYNITEELGDFGAPSYEFNEALAFWEVNGFSDPDHIDRKPIIQPGRWNFD